MDIEVLEKLVGLDLPVDERRELHGDLDKLRRSIERLRDIDVEGVEPAFQTTGQSLPMRHEASSCSHRRSRILERAPAHIEGHVSVPRLVSTEGRSDE